MLINEVTTQHDGSDASAALESRVSLYRGLPEMVAYPIGHETFMPIRLDRKLRDSVPLSGMIFDVVMESNGLPFRKANTASASVRQVQAEMYGAVCRVFPLDGTQYLYSTVVGDFMSLANAVLRQSYDYVDKITPVKTSAFVPSMWSYQKILGPHADLVEKFARKNAKKIFKASQLVVTTDINSITNAMGEVLLFGTAGYYVRRIEGLPWDADI